MPSRLSILACFVVIVSCRLGVLALWVLLLLFLEVLIWPSITKPIILDFIIELSLVSEHAHQILCELLRFDFLFKRGCTLAQLTNCLWSICSEFVVRFWLLDGWLEFIGFLSHGACCIYTGLLDLIESLTLLHCFFDVCRLLL